MSESEDVLEPPDLSNWLLSFLSVQRDEYESQYAPAESDEGRALDEALRGLELYASHLVTTGVLPGELNGKLLAFMPGDAAESKVRELMQLQIVHHRLEFDTAEEVCSRLGGVDKRVGLVTILSLVLLGYNPPPTVVKYFQRATTLYLAGYEPEAIIMCGAVLESALAARFTDEMLLADGVKPIFKRTGDYSVGQRLNYEIEHPVLNESLRKRMSDLVSWRNDAVHVQLDLGPSALDAVINIVLLLPKLLPGT